MKTSTTGNIIAGCLVGILIVGIGYGLWRLERRINYKFSYQSQVQSEIQPLVKRISDLEQRVSVIETNHSK